MTGEMAVQVGMAAVGALGFGLLFHISGSRLVTILLGGAANWEFYLLALWAYEDRVAAFLPPRSRQPPWRRYWRACSKRRS